MSRCRVHKVTQFGDWVFYCPAHHETLWTDEWGLAMEGFWGHLLMRHPRDIP